MSRMLSFRVGRTLTLVASVFLGGCGIVEPYHSESSELSYQWEHWLATGYSSYDFVVVNDCFCITGGVEVEVSVRSGHVVDVRYADTGRSLPPDLAVLYRDIDGLFQVIDDAISQRAYSIDARYNSTY